MGVRQTDRQTDRQIDRQRMSDREWEQAYWVKRGLFQVPGTAHAHSQSFSNERPCKCTRVVAGTSSIFFSKLSQTCSIGLKVWEGARKEFGHCPWLDAMCCSN